MKILALYTAGEPASVALLTPGGEFARELERGRTFERLAPAAHDLLREAALRPRGLDGVALVRGPGSFTGLRVGAALALGLARGAGVPLYAAGTLHLWASLALDPRDAGSRCHVVLDARRNEVYAATFTSPLESESPPRALPPVEALAMVGDGGRVVGDGRELLVAAGMERARPGFADPPQPLALALARWVSAEPERHRCAVQDFTLEYVRDPQAVVARTSREEARARA